MFNKNLKQFWFKGCEDEEHKKEREADVQLASRDVLRIIREELEAELLKSQQEMYSKTVFTSPNFTVNQVKFLAEQKKINEIIKKYLTFD